MSGHGSRAWSWRHAILDSGLKPTTRHVLLTIGCSMNDKGEGCFPTTKQLAVETGLSERAVCEHIALAIDAGWLASFQHGFKGQKWKRNEYRPRWPEPEKGTDAGSVPDALTEDQCLDEGTDGGSVQGTDPDDKKALTEGQSIFSGSSQEPSHSDDERERGKQASKFDGVFAALVDAHGADCQRVVDRFLRPAALRLRVSHENPKGLFEGALAAGLEASDLVLGKAVEVLSDTRKVIMSPRCLTDALAVARQQAKPAERFHAPAEVTLTRADNPQQFAAWARWAEANTLKIQLARALHKLIHNLGCTQIAVPQPWPPNKADTAAMQQAQEPSP